MRDLPRQTNSDWPSRCAHTGATREGCAKPAVVAVRSGARTFLSAAGRIGPRQSESLEAQDIAADKNVRAPLLSFFEFLYLFFNFQP